MLGPAFGNLTVLLVGIAVLVLLAVFLYPLVVRLGARFGFWGERQADAADRAVEDERKRHEYLAAEAKWRQENKR